MKNKNFILQLSLIILGIIFYFVANFQRIAVPGAIFDILEQELSVGAPQIAAFGTTFMYMYAFTACWIGLATILNFTICVSWFYVTILPTFLLVKSTVMMGMHRVNN